jgi:hypothetical protein
VLMITTEVFQKYQSPSEGARQGHLQGRHTPRYGTRAQIFIRKNVAGVRH